MKSKTSSFWLYLLGTYILLQFLWWAWMLIDLNQLLYALEVENFYLSDYPSGTKPPENNFILRKVAMILGEGLVFVLLLGFGFFQVKKALGRELELAKKQRNFLLSVTHELNSPIAGVQLNLETAINRKVDEKKRKQLLNNALGQNNRIKNLVENILTTTRIDENVLQLNIHPVEISELLTTIVEGFNATKHNVISKIEPATFKVPVDQLAFESIIKNLVENALKYSPENAEITVSLKFKNDQAVIGVQDQGSGIRKEHQSKIFERFFRVQNEETRSTRGTGLGLYIAKELTELMGGELSVESGENRGSTFTLKLKTT